MHMLETQRERYADDGEPPLDWERYLELAPALSGLDPDAREEALTTRQLSGDTWSRAEGYWTLTLALDVQRARTDRADAYGVACAAAWAARGVSGQPPEDTLPEAGAALEAKPVAPLPVAALPEASLPVAPPVVLAVVTAPELVVPTFLREAVRAFAEPAPSRTPIEPGPPAYVHVAPPSPAPTQARATLDFAPVALGPVAVLPFAAAVPGGPSRLPPGPSTPARQSGATMDLSDLRSHLGEPAPPARLDSEGRDRRTEAGTVEIDPAMLAAFFVKKPPPR